MNITDHQGMFCNGKAAAFTRGIDTYSGIAAQLAAGVPDPEIAAHVRAQPQDRAREARDV